MILSVPRNLIENTSIQSDELMKTFHIAQPLGSFNVFPLYVFWFPVFSPGNIESDFVSLIQKI